MTVAIAKERIVLDYILNKIIKSNPLLQRICRILKHVQALPHTYSQWSRTPVWKLSVLEDSKTCSEPKYESTKVWNSVL